MSLGILMAPETEALPGVVLEAETVLLTLLEELVVEADPDTGVEEARWRASSSEVTASEGVELGPTTRDPRGFIPGTLTVVHCSEMSLPWESSM